jgi:hypothetical protein
MAHDLNHARHNEAACEHLFATGNFNDWVITTAFYAAVYYVHHELFPGQFEINGRVIHASTFDDYLKNLRGEKKPHSVRIDLVADKLPEIHAEYKTLHDTCWTARYKNYRISDQEVGICKDALKDIRDLCAPFEVDTKS